MRGVCFIWFTVYVITRRVSPKGNDSRCLSIKTQEKMAAVRSLSKERPRI